MSKLLGLLIILGLIYMGRLLFNEYESAKRNNSKKQDEAEASAPSAAPEASAPASGSGLGGLPSSLEAALQTARQQGAAGLKNFLQNYRHAIRDPKLAEIELDYVAAATRSDPGDARRVFKTVQQRTPPSSPLFGRVRAMQKTYE